MEPYLQHCDIIDWQTPAVLALATSLAKPSESATVHACFEFVRDEIQHSWDFQREPITLKASEVLAHQTGYCYAKSHLLAALLRANDIPAGLCYQRLAIDDEQPPFCLHGLNAVYLAEHGWYRLDARGNKPGIDAQFTPPMERLAFKAAIAGEHDFSDIHATPLPVIIKALSAAPSAAWLADHLPDMSPHVLP